MSYDTYPVGGQPPSQDETQLSMYDQYPTRGASRTLEDQYINRDTSRTIEEVELGDPEPQELQAGTSFNLIEVGGAFIKKVYGIVAFGIWYLVVGIIMPVFLNYPKKTLRKKNCNTVTTLVMKLKSTSEENTSNNEKTETYTDEHTILVTRLDTDVENGLTTAGAGRRMEQYRPNSLTPPKKTPKWVKFLKIMFGGIAVLLWTAAIKISTNALIKWLIT